MKMFDYVCDFQTAELKYYYFRSGEAHVNLEQFDIKNFPT